MLFNGGQFAWLEYFMTEIILDEFTSFLILNFPVKSLQSISIFFRLLRYNNFNINFLKSYAIHIFLSIYSFISLLFLTSICFFHYVIYSSSLQFYLQLHLSSLHDYLIFFPCNLTNFFCFASFLLIASIQWFNNINIWLAQC